MSVKKTPAEWADETMAEAPTPPDIVIERRIEVGRIEFAEGSSGNPLEMAFGIVAECIKDNGQSDSMEFVYNGVRFTTKAEEA